jgi:hypothetical protein
MADIPVPRLRIYRRQKQTDGLAMGAPTSSVLKKSYIQHMEHKQMYAILMKRQRVAYFRYVDDTLMIHEQSKTNIELTPRVQETTSICKITMGIELHESTHFLDVKTEMGNSQYIGTHTNWYYSS